MNGPYRDTKHFGNRMCGGFEMPRQWIIKYLYHGAVAVKKQNILQNNFLQNNFLAEDVIEGSHHTSSDFLLQTKTERRC